MPPSEQPTSDVPDMNLYKLSRVHRTLERLKDKDVWNVEDTKDFDCMHYLGDAAIENAAKELGLQSGDRVLDIGSGFGNTGRYLFQHYGARTTGIELQGDIHDIAQTINLQSRTSDSATSINGDFLVLGADKMGAPVDHIVSFLCILHIPAREQLFKKAYDVMKVSGRMYIEDFFARTMLEEETLKTLQESVSCPGLPGKNEYVAELERAGFRVTSWVDMSETWTDFVHQRAAKYKTDPSVDLDLTVFYDAVDDLFTGGQVGGVRITCQKT